MQKSPNFARRMLIGACLVAGCFLSGCKKDLPGIHDLVTTPLADIQKSPLEEPFRFVVSANATNYGILLIGTSESQVSQMVMVNSKDGKFLWKKNLSGFPVSQLNFDFDGAVFNSQYIFYATTTGAIQAIDLETGQESNLFTLPISGILSDVQFIKDDETVYFSDAWLDSNTFQVHRINPDLTLDLNVFTQTLPNVVSALPRRFALMPQATSNPEFAFLLQIWDGSVSYDAIWVPRSINFNSPYTHVLTNFNHRGKLIVGKPNGTDGFILGQSLSSFKRLGAMDFSIQIATSSYQYKIVDRALGFIYTAAGMPTILEFNMDQNLETIISYPCYVYQKEAFPYEFIASSGRAAYLAGKRLYAYDDQKKTTWMSEPNFDENSTLSSSYNTLVSISSNEVVGINNKEVFNAKLN